MRSDEAVEQPLAGLPIQVPQSHGLLDRQSHARQLSVFMRGSSEHGVAYREMLPSRRGELKQ